ncbi:MAG: serine/threonine protein kinase [Candidatus Obscuribacterales bacterium]|jgi:tRNA A-37 threonylcarbamoyl transferase component Bud32|nr:serine/threonine protein kinase [Candidatus Obscuribacterales bacterium]
MPEYESPDHSGQSSPKLLLSYRALPGWFVPLTLCTGILLFAVALASNTQGYLDHLYRLNTSIQKIQNQGLISAPPVIQLHPHNPQDPALRVAPSDVPGLFPGQLQGDQFLTFEDVQRNAKAGDRISALLLIMGALSLALAFAGKDKRLYMDHKGIQFPKAMAAPLGWKLKRSWSELSAIVLARKSESAVPGSVSTEKTNQEIQLLFTSGKANIKCDRLSKAQIESLFHALDELAPHCIRSPELVAFRHKLFSDKSDHSFTQLWEEELASHFAATNFVALTPGQKLQNGKLSITMHLSSGGLSAVYLAEFGKGMAIVKESVVPPGTSDANRLKASQMFQREASLLMQLDHPRIAKVFDHFQENNRDYLLLEYIPGVTLREYVRRHGAQSEAKVIEWTKQLAEILEYLHGQDPPIIHRDITPDNLIITPDGRIVMIDFGAANQFLGAATGTIIGKQFYISPEQFRGKAEPASDIYAVGGTLHYLLTGRDPEALMRSHPAKVNDKLSERIDSIVAKCTEPEISKRLPTAKALLTLLAESQDSLSTDTTSSTNGAQSITVKENEAIYG